MLKKIIISIAIFTVTITCCVLTGFAASIEDDSNPGDPNSDNSLRPGDTTFHYNIKGVRISFVNSNGDQLITSKDYIANISNDSNKNVFVTTNRYNKVSYNSSDSVKWNVNRKKLGEVATDASLFPNNFGINLSESLKSGQFANLFSKIMPENNKNNKNYDEEIVRFFANIMGTQNNLDKYYDEETKKLNIFMIFEPLQIISFGNTLYFGTAHELAVKASQTKGVYGNCQTGLCDLSTSLKHNLPCESYLTGDFFGKDIPGVSVNSYFNNKITIDASKFRTTCNSSKNFTNTDVAPSGSTKLGMGMGVIYLGEIVKVKPISCADVNNGIKWKLQETIKDYYNRKALSDLYKNLPFIDYNKDGKILKAKTEWYVNECSCYGMYEQFGKTTLNYIKELNKGSINNISSNVFGGRTDWYQALDRTTKSFFRDLSITDYKSSAYNNILYTFADYDNKWSEISKKEKLPWTKTSEKYVNLKCETTEIYWCKEFQAWYKETNKKFGLNYPDIYGMTTQDIKGKYRSQVDNMLKAYNTIYYSAMKFYWSIENENQPYFSYSKSCAKDAPPPAGYTCDTINEYYKNVKKNNLKIKDCNYISNFSFTDFNNAHGTNVNNNWYIANCGCQAKQPVDCTPKYNVGTCIKKDNVYYKDSNDWENCIFNDNGSYSIDVHKTSSNSNNTYYDANLSNQYCQVYCVEEMKANFNSDTITVQAGSNFTWNDHYINGSRTCRTKNINWQPFTEDLKEANNATSDRYDEWQLEIKKFNSIANPTRSSSLDCDWYCDYSSHGVSCCKSATRDYDECMYGERNKCVPGYKAYTVAGKIKYEWVPCRYTINTCSGGYGDYYCQAGQSVSSRPHNYTYTPRNSTVSFNGISTTIRPWCGSGDAPSTDVQGAKRKYNNALNYANGLVSDMKSCYEESTWNQYLNNTSPNVNITYTDGTYSYSGQLEAVTSDSRLETKLNCRNTTVGVIKACSGNSCPETYVSMKNCTDVEMTKKVTTNFYLEDGIYNYILKDNNKSVNYNEFKELLESYKNQNKPFNYIKLGYSNFPVAYKTKDGLYGYSSNKGELSLEYSNLGFKKGNNKTSVDNILNSVSNDYNKWLCNYKVVSNLIPRGDIKLLFRPIDLNNPFPDLTGDGRQTGNNWCGAGYCDNKNRVVKDYIINNRNINGNRDAVNPKPENIYNKEPMYSFVLTPPVIREIRKYSKSLGNEYGTFDGISCDAATGRRCISEYLTKLSKITKTSGTCMTNDRKDSFTTCQYKLD